MAFGLVYRFIAHLQVITTNNFSANANSHSAVHYSMYEVFSVCCIFTGCRLVTASNAIASTAHCLTLHNCTALTRRTEYDWSSHIALKWTHREHRLHHLFYYCVTSPCTHMLLALHSNGRVRQVSRHLYCCMQALPSNGWCLQSHLLATRLYAILLFIYVSVAYLTMLSYIQLHSLK
jgi:hypothetical protein